MVEAHIADVTHVIQLAVAPVFLLTAVATVIGVLANRLARIVDRSRTLEQLLDEASADQAPRNPEHTTELAVLAHRMRLVYMAIGLAVVCALCVGLLITLAFVDAFLAINLAKVVGLLFIAAMLAFIVSLAIFLREIFLAVRSAGSKMRGQVGGQPGEGTLRVSEMRDNIR
ncbi:MAG TPA: DUF2721 domain-containing protein [Burkholderiales bacterium]|nr:DUF2721 domain-containing protein [Burkholderiales bacterium]